ncbi:hypothetical protein TBS_29450 [Thermobispora bispora]
MIGREVPRPPRAGGMGSAIGGTLTAVGRGAAARRAPRGDGAELAGGGRTWVPRHAPRAEAGTEGLKVRNREQYGPAGAEGGSHTAEPVRGPRNP